MATASQNPPSNKSQTGIAVIRSYVKNLPASPGVYRMLDNSGQVLYVGKAKSLKNRVNSYANSGGLSQRIARMVSLTASMEFVTTETEAEALLLEANLIKRLAPRYNILLRDDKSFPYILITDDHDFPRIVKHRGAQTPKGEYFGPFATVTAVNEALATLQKAFLLRPCSDHIFAGRNRPCLQYQIKRCSAPCVGLVDKDHYNNLLEQARNFLRGKSRDVQDTLVREMEAASKAFDYEKAAQLRDRIKALTRVQQEQRLHCSSISDADIIGLYRSGDKSCIQVFFFRAGQNFGNRAFFPSHAAEASSSDILEAFIGQFYQTHVPPRLVLLSEPLNKHSLMEDALSLRADFRGRVQVQVPARGEKLQVVKQVVENAREALLHYQARQASQGKLLEAVGELFGLEEPPQRIEVYDNSHIMGSHAIGGMITAGPEGFVKNAYRRFNIKGDMRSSGAQPSRETIRAAQSRRDAKQKTTSADVASLEHASCARVPACVDARNNISRQRPKGLPEQEKISEANKKAGGDDYAMLRETLLRRFSRLQKEDGIWPDLVLIDGGAAHLTVAANVFEEMGISNVPFVCIAKGRDRNAGREWFHIPGKAPFQLPPHDPALHYLQRLRDEAHRYAIGSHRTRRSKAIRKSELDDIIGIGAARKKALLHHFGSARAVANATLADLENVAGINKKTAETIFNYFHSS